MACPKGCVNGGGQAKPKDSEDLKAKELSNMVLEKMSDKSVK